MRHWVSSQFARHHWFLPYYLGIVGIAEAIVIIRPFG